MVWPMKGKTCTTRVATAAIAPQQHTHPVGLVALVGGVARHVIDELVGRDAPGGIELLQVVNLQVRACDHCCHLVCTTLHTHAPQPAHKRTTTCKHTHLKALHQHGALAPGGRVVGRVVAIVAEDIGEEVGKGAAIHALEVERVKKGGVLGLGHGTHHAGGVGKQLQVLAHGGDLEAGVVEALVAVVRTLSD